MTQCKPFDYLGRMVLKGTGHICHQMGSVQFLLKLRKEGSDLGRIVRRDMERDDVAGSEDAASVHVQARLVELVHVLMRQNKLGAVLPAADEQLDEFAGDEVLELIHDQGVRVTPILVPLVKGRGVDEGEESDADKARGLTNNVIIHGEFDHKAPALADEQAHVQGRAWVTQQPAHQVV